MYGLSQFTEFFQYLKGGITQKRDERRIRSGISAGKLYFSEIGGEKCSVNGIKEFEKSAL